MPYARRCPHCLRLVTGDCPECKPARRKEYDEQRGNASARGYDNNWRKFRAMVLSSRPLCEDCQLQGRTMPANEVHHIQKVRDRPELRLEWSNVMSLCKSCHTARTNRGE